MRAVNLLPGESKGAARSAPQPAVLAGAVAGFVAVVLIGGGNLIQATRVSERPEGAERGEDPARGHAASAEDAAGDSAAGGGCAADAAAARRGVERDLDARRMGSRPA